MEECVYAFHLSLQASGWLSRCWFAAACAPLQQRATAAGEESQGCDAVGRSLASNAPAAFSLLQQEQRQLLRVRACGCEGECAGAGRSALPSSPPASFPPPARAALPWDQHPLLGRASLNPAPAISSLQLGSRKAPFCRGCVLSQGEEGSFLHFGAAANEGNLLGISLALRVSASRAAGGTRPLGARRILAPEAGAASSLGIGAGVSAPQEEPLQSRRSRVEEVTAPLPGFYFFFLSASPSPPQARTMVQSHWLPCPPLL